MKAESLSGTGQDSEQHGTLRNAARQRLFAYLVGHQLPSRDTLNALCEQADWPLPDTVRAVASSAFRMPRWPETAGRPPLVCVGTQGLCLLMPDPTTHSQAAVADAFDGVGAVIGPVVTHEEAGASLRWAQSLLNIRSAHDAAGIIFAEDHLSTLILLHNESLAMVLADRLLEPLATYTPRQRDRIEETLLAWLEQGGAPEAARYLQVHPQTVRYRMRQIEKIFGPSLREPDTRFNLELALRSRQFMSGVPRVRPHRVPQRRWSEPRAVAGPSAREARKNGL